MTAKSKKSSLAARPKKLSVSIARKKADYDTDFYQWVKSQTKLLVQRDFSHLDMDHLIEEFRDLGNSNKRALKSYCVVLLTHLLKIKYQPNGDCKSWRSSISHARTEMSLLLEDSPSLKRELKKSYAVAYEKARENASYETGVNLDKIAQDCPWTVEEALRLEHSPGLIL